MAHLLSWREALLTSRTWYLGNRALARGRAVRRDEELRTVGEPLRGAEALEIGGPSAMFGRDRGMALYERLGVLDSCDFAEQTLWSGATEAALKPRRTLVSEASAPPVAPESYDAVLASHVIEHLADPIGTLRRWRSILRSGGHLLLVVPHRDGTFDHRRPVSSHEHLLADAEAATPEEDLSHLQEVLSLHDLDRDPGVSSRAQFAERARRNASLRSLHHHVFVSETVVFVCDAAGFAVERVLARRPFHVVCLARATDPCSPAAGAGALAARRSPFPSDRRCGARR